MEESFGEYVAATDAIRDILRGYPFSIGLLREILQNSDDAKATRQGPALLAFNDGLLQPKDWTALREIHRSSKVADSMKIGKFGLGFRSCYHVTDMPHILSGSHFAILDPHRRFREDGGFRVNIIDNHEDFASHLAAFDSILPKSKWGKPYKGTIFRFPLRTVPSQISAKTTSATEIAELLRSFAREELAVSLLFLRNISSIEVCEVTADGGKIDLAKASIDRDPFEDYRSRYQTCKVSIKVLVAGSLEEEEWRILHAPFSEAEALENLAECLERSVMRTRQTLSDDKLNPTIELAIPCDSSKIAEDGRLFTFLPLPLKTQFPIHINGIVSDSEDRARVEWNRLLFDTYIPRAWAMLLEVLVREDHIPNIFVAWPKIQADVHSGDAMYWKDMPLHVAEHALELNVWPISGTNPPLYQRISSLIVEERSTELEGVVAALVQTGVQITRLPQYLTNIIVNNYMHSIKVLSPQIAYTKLGSFIRQLRDLDDEGARVILTYLLSTSECKYIHGLPIVPSVSGGRITLRLKTLASSRPFETSHVLFDETAETLFREYDPEAVSLEAMAPSARSVLIKYGAESLNVVILKPPRVLKYLEKSPYTYQFRGTVDEDQMEWLNLFWEWAESAEFSRYVNRREFFLVPTTTRTQRPNDVESPVVDPRFCIPAGNTVIRLQCTSDIQLLLLATSPSTSRLVEFKESDAAIFCDYLIKHLPLSCENNGSTLQKQTLERLRSLPVFPLISVSEDGELTTSRAFIPLSVTVQGVDPTSVPVLPRLDNTVYLNLNSINVQMLQYLNPTLCSPLTPNAMQDLMLLHFSFQTPALQLAFVQYLTGLAVIPPRVRNSLAETRFMLSCEGTFQAPKYLVDPQSPVASLFPGPSSRLPSLLHPTYARLVELLREFGLLITILSTEIIHDRIRFINTNQCPNPDIIARCLIHLLNDAHPGIYQFFDHSLISQNFKWIPTANGLKSPLQCRDLLSHQGKTDLFDEAMPLVSADVVIGPRLRDMFGWNKQVSVDILSRQLVNVTSMTDGSFSTPYHKVLGIVKELGNRCPALTEEQLSSLRQALYLTKWVPTQSGTLEMVEFALLSNDDIPEAGFHSVAFDSIRYPQICSFLSVMGCVERPSKATIFAHLRTLYRKQPRKVITQQFINGVIRLLAWLPRLEPEDRGMIFVPDDGGFLSPYNAVYFNDVGPRAAFHNIESGRLTHPNISPELASDLGLQRLGLMGFQEQSDNLDIDLTAAIRTRLQDYSDHRVLLDLISVALDAHATEVNVLLDEAFGPSDAVLSPKCQELQRSPALVFQYNGVFTETSLIQLLYSCGAGNFNRKPLAGEYGCGALAMFHVTEFATVVSQGQVWFINPSKTYIGIDNAILRLPLSAVQRSYGDHLAPLLGLVGFSIPDDPMQDIFYNGTILRLPLRSSSTVNPIFTRVTSLQSLTSDFKSFSSKCLLFTSLESISLYDRPRQQRQAQRIPDLRFQWSMRVSRKDQSHSHGDVCAYTVTITNPASLQSNHEWRIIALDTKTTHPPGLASLNKLYRMKDSPTIHLAVQLGSRPSRTHTLFSSLPHLVSIDLPAHLSAPFFLTPDMASLRLDENQGPEVSYNRWLLTTIIPTLYLRMLEDRASVGDNTVYWPGPSKVALEDAPNDPSTLVGNAVYQMALADKSTHQIFRSRYHSVTHPPRTARFITQIPRAVSALLSVIKPDDIIELSPAITKRLQGQKSRHFSVVSPKYLHKQLLDHPDLFSPSNLDHAQIQEVLNFLCNDNDPFSCLSGLPLLLLNDGTFTKFGHASSTPSFYAAPSQVLGARVFSSSRLVHPLLDPTKLLAIRNLNVKPINETNIRILLDDFITASDTLENADHEKQRWIHTFWEIFSSLEAPVTAISKYPLIPTLKSGHFLSLGYCKKSAILADFQREPTLRTALAQMGLTVVDTASLPPELRHALPPSPLTVNQVLSNILNRDSAEITGMFNSLDSKTRPALISWIRKDWQRRKRSYFRDHANYRILPIWKAADGSYVSANEVQMLPRTVSANSIGPFASKVLVGHDLILVEMGLEPPTSIRSLLQIPSRLEEGQDKAYRDLLQNVLFQFTQENAAIPVPNTRREIRDSNTLYSARDDLFTAAFGSNSEHFIHRAFFQFETPLEKHGLKRQQNLTLDMFRVCVEAFHNAGGKFNEEKKRRADTLFWFWGEELPERLTTLNQDKLSTLDDFRFISRNMVPRPLGSANDAKYTHQLPAIVSPNELVRHEFHPIAWTQRGFYRPGFQPPSSLVKMHRNLSVPTAEEVVNHLVVLATKVALEVDHTCRSTVLDHLEQTYEWLNKHADDAKPFLEKCKTEGPAIFLNAEKPQITPMDKWTWKRADHIILNSEFDREYLQFPRAFIKPFQPLLIAAGAITIDYGTEEKQTVELPENEDRYSDLCGRLNRMRRNGICVDTSFTFDPTLNEKPLNAHRTYLAAYSPYFMKLFSSTEQAEMSVVHVDKLFSKHAVEILLDYVYTSQEPDLAGEGDRVRLAVELLSLAHKWEMSDAQRVVQNKVMTLKIVDPFTLETIRDAARRTESKELVDYCEEYEKKNKDFIRLVKEEGGFNKVAA
ncbi:hypothetical protein NP233_g1854 [Leucocoprinus birnbaumii]|uniref:BTB domain-containing protein n=1 Tax=Leucocoprinus birnbaumii TaxID=56174 RepID=A0AAD5YZ83_9AGAR|nr:hypothetical protein NP233_g1854 [Leucocoprinus birnbaumii]